MRRILGASCAIAIAWTCVGCSPSDDASSRSSASGSAVASTAPSPPTTTPLTELAPTVAAPPVVNGTADTGCVDEPGAESYPPDEWFDLDAGLRGGVLSLGGDAEGRGRRSPFVDAARRAVGELAPGFDGMRTVTYRSERGGCVTNRTVSFSRDGQVIIVSAWRLEAATDPGWVPYEGRFRSRGNGLVTSDGPHIAVAIVAAADGTTVRISAYGEHVDDRVAGWPSTFPAPPDAPPIGPVPFTSVGLVPSARRLLAEVLDAR